MTSFDEAFDFVIIGSGAGSVTAAMTAKERGGTAVIIEKQNVFGGSTAYSGGVAWIPNSHLMTDDTEERSRTYLNAAVERAGDSGKASPPAKREMFLKQGPAAIRFMADKGIKFIHVFWPDYYSSLPGGHEYGRSLMVELFNLNELGDWNDKVGSFYGFPPMPVNSWEFVFLTLAKRTWKGRMSALGLGWRMMKDKMTGSRTVGSGVALQGRMLQLALREQIPIRLGTEMVDLITEDGRVVGVRVKDAAGERRIEARRGVLLDTGGFSHNLAMRQKYQPKPASVDWTMSNPGDTGDGIRVAQDLGADVDVMNEAWWTPGSLIDGKFAGFHVPGESAKPHIIIVDKYGRRVGNEAGSYMEFGQKMYAAGAVPAYAIIESRALDYYTFGPIRPGARLQDFLDNGYIKKADTLANSLGRAADLDPQGLEAEVAKFNGYAAKGVDPDFGRGASAHNRSYGDPTNKPNAALGPIEKPPFYAVVIWPMDVGTSGGVVTDEYARVLREDGAPILGLYAVGNATAPVVGRGYPGAGASIGGAIAFGHVAAKHAFGWNAGP